ncbi:MAG TPA: flippase [Gaiellaceae bacterium]|nr:flippase [Gaiellaceae bacterium]
MQRGRVVARNVGWNLASQLWLVLVGLLVTPYVVHRLDVPVYGLFTLLLAFTAYFAMLDLGFGYATTKYVAEYRARGDTETVQRLASTSLTVYLALATAGGVGLAAVSPLLVRHVLAVPVRLQGTAQTAFLVASLAFSLTMILQAYQAFPNALQRLDLTTRRTIVLATASSGGIVGVLALGRGLLAVLAVQAAVNATAVVVFALLARRLLPEIRLRPGFDRATFRLLARFSLLKFANNVSTNTVMQVDKLLVGALLSLGAVGYYVVPLQLAQRLTTAVGAVSVAFLPAASALHGGGDRARLDELYLRATKLVALLGLPLASLLVVFAHPILQLWIDARFADESATTLQVLAVGYGINVFSTIPAIASDSLGRPGVTTSFSVLSACLNVALSLALIPRFGIVGSAVAIAVNSATLVPAFVWYVHRHVLELPLRAVLRRSIAAPAVAAALALAPMLLLRETVRGPASLALALALGFAAYLALTVAVRAYDETDRALVRAYLARSRGAATVS